MTRISRKQHNFVVVGFVIVALLGVFGAAIWASRSSVLAASDPQHGRSVDEDVEQDVFAPLPMVLAVSGAGVSLERVADADFTFLKTVMLQADFDSTQSCARSVKALTVAYGTPVVYCYRFKNIGTSTFLTVTMVDDKLGTLGPLALTPPFQPDTAGGFLAYGVPMTRTITNTATITLEDDQGNAVVKSDSATVLTILDRLYLPLLCRP